MRKDQKVGEPCFAPKNHNPNFADKLLVIVLLLFNTEPSCQADSIAQLIYTRERTINVKVKF